MAMKVGVRKAMTHSARGLCSRASDWVFVSSIPRSSVWEVVMSRGKRIRFKGGLSGVSG